jgi:hypothetical protein
MKKITLALFALIGTFQGLVAQTNIDVIAPPTINTTSQLRLPNGMPEHKNLKGVCLLRASELTALTGSIVNSIGFIRIDGTGTTPSTGNFTVYLENTSDVTYSKGTSFSSAISTMAQHYNGGYTVPLSATTTTVTLNLTPTFTYTGGGIYVAWEWEELTPSPNTNNNYATYAANNAGAGNALSATSYSTAMPAPNTMTIGDFRPSFVFNAVNTATNEVQLVDIIAPGLDSKLDGGQFVEAKILNKSSITLNNVPVTLNVTGANTFANTQTVASVAAGAVASVTFAVFAPATSGINTLVATVPADENPSNNGLSWTQSVTCNDVALYPVGSPTMFINQGRGAGNSAGGLIYAFRHTPAVTASVTSVSLVVPSFSNANNLNNNIFPVVLDANGAIVAQGPTVPITAGMLDQFSALTFTSPVALSANQAYHIGVGMPTNQYFPVGTLATNYTVAGYYSAPVAGGQLTVMPTGYMSLHASLSFSNTTITASANRTFVCKGETTTLTVNGAAGNTYTWTQGGSNQTSVVFTPTLPGTQGMVSYVVNSTDPTTQCRSNTAIVSVSVNACTGLGELPNADLISVFPNPAVNGIASVKGLQGEVTISVMNITGQVVLTQTTSQDSFDIDLSNYAAGTYFVKIADKDNQVKIVKLVNQK